MVDKHNRIMDKKSISGPKIYPEMAIPAKTSATEVTIFAGRIKRRK
jgi:hypothetical protein